MDNQEQVKKILREELFKQNDVLNEEITKADEKQISKILKKELDKKDVERKLTDLLSKKLLKNKDVEEKMVEVASNVVTQLFKTLWVRRNVWRTRLKNKAN